MKRVMKNIMMITSNFQNCNDSGKEYILVINQLSYKYNKIKKLL